MKVYVLFTIGNQLHHHRDRRRLQNVPDNVEDIAAGIDRKGDLAVAVRCVYEFRCALKPLEKMRSHLLRVIEVARNQNSVHMRVKLAVLVPGDLLYSKRPESMLERHAPHHL
jgi:hypothetical protein